MSDTKLENTSEQNTENKIAKWFVVATSGTTVDGREIKAQWIEQCAKNYDPKVYGARINLEHIRFTFYRKDEPHSQSYGDVLALKTKTQGEKVQLLALIDPTPELLDFTNNRQKIYSSVEIVPKFADTNEAYLVGLAITDTPASLGTEALKFSKQPNSELFTARMELAEEEMNKEKRLMLLLTRMLTDIVENFKIEDLNKQFSEQKQKIQQLEASVTELQKTIEKLRQTPVETVEVTKVTGANDSNFIF